MSQMSVTLCAEAQTGDSDAQWYAIAGLPLRSVLPLPLPVVRPPRPQAPHCVIRLGDPQRFVGKPGALGPEVGWQSDHISADQPGSVVYRGSDGVWWWSDGIGAFHISADARLIELHPESEAKEQLIGLLLTGPVASLVLPQFGFPALHASAVVTGQRAVAFLGAKQQGKSTLASVFLQRGAVLLTDDLLPLQFRHGTVYAMPGPPYLKVWGPTAEHVLGLNPDALPNLSETLPKKLLRVNGTYQLAQQRERLSALYVLDRRDSTNGADGRIDSRQLGLREALPAVLAHVSQGLYLPPSEMAALLPAFAQLAMQTPVRVLSYPTGFDRQDALYEFIVREIEGM